MANTRKTAGDTATREDAEQIQQAQIAEANGTARSFDFEGYDYHLLEGQPSPKALTYVARWQVDDENLAMVLAMVEMLGSTQWEAWCRRHSSEQLMPFWLKLNRAAGGDEGN